MADSTKFYVVKGDKTLVEGMTKEQTLAAITQAVEEHEIHDVDTGFVTTLKESNKNRPLKFWVGKQSEYNAITTPDDNTFYIISDSTYKEDLETEIAELQAAVSRFNETTSFKFFPNDPHLWQEYDTNAAYCVKRNGYITITGKLKVKSDTHISANQEIWAYADESLAIAGYEYDGWGGSYGYYGTAVTGSGKTGYVRVRNYYSSGIMRYAILYLKAFEEFESNEDIYISITYPAREG